MPGPDRPRILVAEDDPDLLRMLDHVLGTLGEVVRATDGQEAWELAQGGLVPDVVVTDLMMPRMDGLTLTKNLRSVPALSRVPVVLLTARTGTRDVIAGIHAGARYYLTKPFKTEDLLAKVSKALGIRR